MKKAKTDKTKKQGYILLLTLCLIAALIILYNKLLQALMLKAYSPYYFTCVKLPVSFSYFNLIYPFCLLLFLTVCIFLLTTVRKKYIPIIILCAALLATIIFSCNVWNFDKDVISYNTLFQKNKIVYSFDDIDRAELDIKLYFGRSANDCLEYTLYMNDGEQIKFDAFDSFRKDDDKLIEFDTAISDKRTTVGDFGYLDNASDELNSYLKVLFQSNP